MSDRLKSIKIIDVILHKNKYSTQKFLVVDRMPVIEYEKKIINGLPVLIGTDGIFGNLYYYQKPGSMFQAFAGRKFNIPMKDGTFIEAYGQWWHGSCGEGWKATAIGSPKTLGKCNVFTGYDIKESIYEQVIANFTNPSNNYYKYSPRDESYGKNIIEERIYTTN